jgi:hypothetical protein
MNDVDLQTTVQSILYNAPPSIEFAQLSSLERAAYLYYFTLYRRHFEPIDVFKNRFRREFYTYTCNGLKAEDALTEVRCGSLLLVMLYEGIVQICKHTRREFEARRAETCAKAYDASQKHQFSDDRETPDSRSVTCSFTEIYHHSYADTRMHAYAQSASKMNACRVSITAFRQSLSLTRECEKR